MSVRRVSLGGLEVTVDIPDRLVRALRGTRGSAGANGKPSVGVSELAATDPQRALDFLRGREFEGDGVHRNERALQHLADHALQPLGAPTLADEVAALPWYHTIDLPGGIVTPGKFDHRPLVQHVGFPDDLRAKRVLDVATFDGFWSFEMERRGADVTAIDVPSVAQFDWPRDAGSILRNEGIDTATGAAFAVAHRALGSHVERVPMSVYDLDPHRMGTFDLVFVGGLLVHLDSPLQALRRVRSVTSGSLILVEPYDRRLTGSGEPLIRYRGGWDGMQWWEFSVEVLLRLVVDAGFERVSVWSGYDLTARGATASSPRVVLHAVAETHRGALDLDGERPRSRRPEA